MRRTFVLTLLAVAVAGVVGTGVLSHLTAGGFTDPGSESDKARVALQQAPVE